jgi:CRISPR system Cascade subunit CasE
VDIRIEAELLGWLTRKGDANGFRPVAVRAYPDVPDVRTGREGTLKGRKPGMNLTFGSVVFDGELVVTDAAAFRRALAQGIGSGKAYGFGLLSVARAGT